MSTTTMSPSHPNIYTYFYYSSVHQHRFTNKFDCQTTMEEIDQYVRKEFEGYLQNEYFIQLINPRTNELIILDQAVLDSEDNPFKNISSTDDPFTAIMDSVELSIVEYLPRHIETHEQQTSMDLLDQISDNTKKFLFSDAFNSSAPSLQFSSSTAQTVWESRGHEGLLEFDLVFSRIQFF